MREIQKETKEMSDTEKELQRIKSIADRLYVCWQDEPENLQMLACLLLRLEPSYFWRVDRGDRKKAQELLTPDLKNQAVTLHKLIGMSDFSDFLKSRICGACELYLAGILTEEEMKVFKKSRSYDPASYDWLFEGLEA